MTRRPIDYSLLENTMQASNENLITLSEYVPPAVSQRAYCSRLAHLRDTGALTAFQAEQRMGQAQRLRGAGIGSTFEEAA